MPTTQEKITSWLEKDVIPFIGTMPTFVQDFS